jgi:branched-chain amino acid aminotransferase
MTFTVELNPNPRSAAERDAILEAPGFGRYFTDHMVRIDYADGVWGQPAVLPYGPISLDPATAALHYGQEIFEGLKAYRQPDGSIATFRADANAARFQRSAQRLGMAELPTELFVESLRELVAVDSAWVPGKTD